MGLLDKVTAAGGALAAAQELAAKVLALPPVSAHEQARSD